MNLYKSGYIVYSSSLSQSIFDVTESINYSKTYNTESIVNTALTYDGTNYIAYVGLLSLDTKGISERKVLTNSILSYVITGSTINFRSKTLPEGVENTIKLVAYNGNLDTDSAYSIISSSHQSLIVGEIDLTDYYTYTTGSNNYQAGTLVNSGSFTVNISSSVVNIYGYTNLIGYVDHLYQKKDFNEKETLYQISSDGQNNLLTKLNSPTQLPPVDSNSNFNGAKSVAFSPDDTYLAVGHYVSPYVTMYKRSGDRFNKISNLYPLPPTFANSVAFSPDGNYLAVASHNPSLSVYKRSGDSFTRLPNLPDVTGLHAGNNVKFSNNGTYLAFAHSTNSVYCVYIYKRSGDTFTKLSSNGFPTKYCVALAFSPDDTYLAVGSNTSPYIHIYKRNGDSFNKLADPDVLPELGSTNNSNFVSSIAFSPDNTHLVVGSWIGLSPIIYKRSGDTFTKIDGINSLNNINTNDDKIRFSSDGNYLAIGSSIYKRSGDTFTKIDGINGSVVSYIYISEIAFSSNDKYLAIGSSGYYSYPYISLYKSQEIIGNYTQTILPLSDIGDYTVISQSIPNHVYNKIIEPSTTGTITFSSSLSQSVYDVSSSLEYSRSYGELISSVELDDNTYTCKVGFVSFDVPVYKSNSYTYTASINIKFNQNSQISRSNVLPDEVEDKLYILKYDSDVLTDNPYNIITSSYQIPESKLINTVDLSKYYSYTTSSDGNVASSSNIGYYTASIIVPDEYITYGETNNFLIYNDYFVKKQNFINQVEGYDIEQGLYRNDAIGPLQSYTCDFSDDGKYLAVGGYAEAPNSRLEIYKQNGNSFTKLDNISLIPQFSIQSVSFSPNGSYLAVGSYNPGLTVYKIENDVFTTIPITTSFNNASTNIVSVEFSPDNNYLAVGSNNSPYLFMFKRTEDTFTQLSIPSLPVDRAYSVSFSPNGSYLAVGIRTTPFVYIYIRSGDNFIQSSTLSDAASLVETVGFSPDSNYLAVGKSGTSAFIYKRSGNSFTKLNIPDLDIINLSVNTVSFSPNNNYLLIGATSGQSIILKRSGDTFTKLINPNTTPNALPVNNVWDSSFSADGNYLAIANGSNKTLIFTGRNITQNKTSFRLNPDIELEIDVKYPIAYLSELMGVSR